MRVSDWNRKNSIENQQVEEQQLSVQAGAAVFLQMGKRKSFIFYRRFTDLFLLCDSSGKGDMVNSEPEMRESDEKVSGFRKTGSSRIPIEM